MNDFHPNTTLPAKTAGKRLHYTTDYVTKLCREGKLDCVQIGAAWFVKKNSLTAFKNTRTSQKGVRALELLRLRQQELDPPRPSLTQPTSAFLPMMLLAVIILVCMTLSIFILTIPIR